MYPKRHICRLRQQNFRRHICRCYCSKHSIARNGDKPPPTNRVFPVIWLIVCAIGLSIHGWFTTEEYLEYATTTQVRIMMPQEINPPSISLCFELYDYINHSALPTDERLKYAQCHPESAQIIDADICLINLFEWMSKLDAGKLLNDWTYNMTLFNKQYVYYKQPLAIEEYYRHGRRCFKYSRYVTCMRFVDNIFSCLHTSTFRTDYQATVMHVGAMDSMEPLWTNLMTISFENLFNGTGKRKVGMAMYIHPADRLSHVRDGNARYLQYKPMEENYVQITYEYIESHLLPQPFKSDCLDYGETGYESRGDCLERCYEANYYTKWNEPAGVISTRNYSEVTLRRIADLKYDNTIDSKCYPACRIGCTTIDYVSIINSQFYVSGFANEFFVPVMSTRPYFTVTSIQAFNFSNFIIFIASITGLWLGWSLYGTVIQVVNYVKTAVYRIIRC